MNPQFLFYDIDGTLYLPWLGVSEKVKTALLDAKRRGHKLFLCTGRPLIGIPAELQALPFDGVIGSGGASIQLGDEVVLQKFIPQNALQLLMDQLDSLDVAFELETNQGTYYSEGMITLCERYKNIRSDDSEMARLTHGKDMSLMRRISDFKKQPVQVSKVAFLSEQPEQIEALKKRLSDTFRLIVFHIAPDGTTNGEILLAQVNKGAAIRKVCQLLHHDMKDTIGFGDSINDLEMLCTCNTSVVMEDADALLKEQAAIVCPSVRDDGVYHAMVKLELCAR